MNNEYLGYVFIVYELNTGIPLASFFDEDKAIFTCECLNDELGVPISWIGINLPVFLDDRRSNSKEFI